MNLKEQEGMYGRVEEEKRKWREGYNYSKSQKIREITFEKLLDLLILMTYIYLLSTINKIE